MDAWSTQQTAETIAERYRNMRFVTPEEAAKNMAEYKAEKVRKYKIRLINEWRAKNK